MKVKITKEKHERKPVTIKQVSRKLFSNTLKMKTVKEEREKTKKLKSMTHVLAFE